MTRLTSFIRGADQSLDFAVYDMRFSSVLRDQLATALRERAGAGVKIRFCFDGDKPSEPNVAAGQDPAPAGTSMFIESLGYPWRRIAGRKLMHNKFIVRDAQSIWTGSTNLTDDAFTLMENNVLAVDSPGFMPSPKAKVQRSPRELVVKGKLITCGHPILAGFTRAEIDTLALMHFDLDRLVTTVATDIVADLMTALH